MLGGATMGTEGERFLTAFGMTTLGQGGEKQVPHPATRSGAQTARSVPFEAQGKRDDNVKSAGRAAQPSRMRRFCGWPVFASGEGRAFCFVSGCFRPAAGSRLDMGMFANRSAVGAPLFGIRGRIKSPAPAEPGTGARNTSSFSHGARSYAAVGSFCAGSFTDDSARAGSCAAWALR